MFDIQKLIKKGRKRATSPIVATMMMIGLTVVSGAILYGVTMAFVSTQPTLDLSYNSQAVYKSTTNSILNYDPNNITSVQISVTNPSSDQITIDLSTSKLYLASDNSALDDYKANSATTGAYLTLSGKESADVVFNGTNANSYLNIGDQYYAVFTILSPDLSESKLITTSTFTVTPTAPYFKFFPDTQHNLNLNAPIGGVGNTVDVTFYAQPEETATVNITGVLWNIGNADSSYQKRVQFYVEPDKNFTIDDQQFVDPSYMEYTIPASTHTGFADVNDPTICTAGYACVNISIPVTKKAFTPQEPVGAYLSISGLDLQFFSLKVESPTVRITLENTNIRNWGFFRWRRNQNYCPSAPNWNNDNQQGNTIIYYGSPSCTDTKTITFDIWNLLDTPNTANIEISGLNTTAFTLLTSSSNTRWNTYDDNPQSVSLTAGPNQINNRWLTYCRRPTQQACNTVTWGIARNPLIDSNGNPTGIEAGSYPITITDLNSGTQQIFELYIQPYAVEVHVASMSASYSNNRLTYTVKVVDADGQPVNNIKVSADYTYPSNNGRGRGRGNTQTTSMTSYTNINGEATFTNWNPRSGKNTLLVTDLSAFTWGNRGRWSRFASMTVIYDASANNPNPPQWSITI